MKHKLIKKKSLRKFIEKHPNTQSIEPKGNKVKVNYLKNRNRMKTGFKKCKVDGCELKSRTRGWCNVHYERWRQKGDVNWQPETQIERFVNLIDIKDNGCWEWIGSKGHGGYGLFHVIPKKSQLAHRWSYKYFRGEIPAELTVDHKCNNPSCVNPHHLQLLTQLENNMRNPHFGYNKTHCPKGHEYTPENTYQRPNIKAGTRRHRDCRMCNKIKNDAQRALAKQKRRNERLHAPIG